MDRQELKNKVEAILFASGKKISADYIAKLCKTRKEEVLETLNELKSAYQEKNASLSIIDEGELWRIAVKEAYSPIVRKIVPQTELTKTMIETLAVIAWKAPVLQSDVIKIRTNKAYEHLAELEKTGFISREKHSRTQIIKLTQRFYDYFDVHSEQEIKDKFRSLAKQEAAKIQEEQTSNPEAIQTQTG
ncbi:SMC-Scp complex subunit ScpB [Candidatus Woesearchaeota archaeon]|nr:SMC-Scp complex subunit ScpB [Candidatus Woesearchaeota archaeon]